MNRPRTLLIGSALALALATRSLAWAESATEGKERAEDRPVVLLPGERAHAPQSVAPLAPGEVEIHQFGDPEDVGAYRSGSFLGVRFDPPFDCPYTISRIRFPSATVNGVPAVFPSVSLVRASASGRIEGPPIFRIAPFMGSPDGVNEVALDLPVIEAGRTYYWCVEFPPTSATFPNDYPFMRMDFRDQEKGFFANSFNVSPTANALPQLITDRNLAVSMLCELESTQDVAIAPSSNLGANRVSSDTNPLGELVFTFTPSRDIRLDGAALPKNSLRRTDFLYRTAPNAPWTLFGSVGPNTKRFVTEPFPSGLLTWATQAVDRWGHRSITSNVVLTTNFIPGRPSSSQDDAYEPNGRRQDATSIPSLPAAIEATYYPAGDEDYYSVEASPGEQLIVVVSRSAADGANDLLPAIRLIDRRGDIVASAAGNPALPNPRIEYLVPKPADSSNSHEAQRFTIEVSDDQGSWVSPDSAPRVIVGFPAYVLSVQVQDGPGVGTGKQARLSPTLRRVGRNPTPGEVWFAWSPGPSDEKATELRIYDVRGRFVRALTMSGGAGRIVGVYWDGRDEAGRPVGNGTYFATIRCGRISQSQKVILLR